MTNTESPQQPATLTIDQALQQADAHHQSGKLQDAERLYRAILQIQPNHPDANHNLGVLAVQVKQPTAGLPHFKAALGANPNQRQYWLSYIDALIQAGSIDIARQVLEQGRRRGLQGEAVESLAGRLGHLETATPDQPAELACAIVHREAGRYKEAELVLQSWLASHPQDASSYALLAQVLSLDKQDEPAWVALNTALSINPVLPTVQRNYARLLLKQQKSNEALQAAQAAYQSDTADPENQLVLAAALGANNQIEPALSLVERALQTYPNYAEAFANRALLKLRSNDLAGALADAEKALSIKPHLAQLWGMVGSLRHQFKNLPGAIDALEKALGYEPDNVGYLVNLGEFKRQTGDVESAIAILEKATIIAPDNASAWANLGTAFQQAQRIPEAKAAYAKALKIAPEQAEVASNLGALAKVEENWEEALRYFDQALKYQPTRIAILTNRVTALNALERHDEAEQAGRHAIEIEPENAEVHFVLFIALIGKKHYEAARVVLDTLPNADDIEITYRLALSYTTLFCAQDCWTEAEAWARRALVVKPKEVKVLRQLGAILGEQNRYEDAWAVLQEALENSPADTDTFQAVASHHARQEHWLEAEAWVRRVLAVKPKEVKVLRQLGAILGEQNRYEDAWVVLMDALENSPKDAVDRNWDADTWLAMASHHARQQHWIEAEVWIRRALEIKPDYAEAHYNLGVTLQDMGRLDEAEASYCRALEIKPDYAEAYSNLGNILKDLSRLDEAEASYRRALEIKPYLAEAHSNLSVLLQDLGRLDEAEMSCHRVLEIKSDYAEAHSNLGVILRYMGRLDEAEACYRRALEIKPDSVQTLSNLGSILQDMGRLDEAETSYQRMLEIKSDHVPSDTAPPVTALLPFGRSGSLFFHSLFDGHPEIATLPGVYFKGWFGIDRWKRFAPNIAKSEWREHLVEMILNEYQPLFDAHCKKNVPGKPLDSNWPARDLGFMDMGPDRSQHFVLDQNSFAKAFLSLLTPLSSVGQKDCFELIHRAFEMAIRGNTASGAQRNGHIFYHIHNPDPYELTHFLQHYPQARLLHIMRNPVQSMESWMLMESAMEMGDVDSMKDAAARSRMETDYRIYCWNSMIKKVAAMFTQMQSPFNRLAHSRGVRLEDVKRDPKRVMPQIAAWMGIPDHPALYEASFCGLQYWGPASKTTGKITGFDTKAIDQPVGRLLGTRDILIFETLFWPLSHLYGYTDLGAAGFRRQLAEIRPWLDEPLEFEAKFYAELPEHSKAIEGLPVYRRLHRLLHELWAVLERDGTYQGMVQPLELD